MLDKAGDVETTLDGEKHSCPLTLKHYSITTPFKALPTASFEEMSLRL